MMFLCPALPSSGEAAPLGAAQEEGVGREEEDITEIDADLDMALNPCLSMGLRSPPRSPDRTSDASNASPMPPPRALTPPPPPQPLLPPQVSTDAPEDRQPPAPMPPDPASGEGPGFSGVKRRPMSPMIIPATPEPKRPLARDVSLTLRETAPTLPDPLGNARGYEGKSAWAQTPSPGAGLAAAGAPCPAAAAGVDAGVGGGGGVALGAAHSPGREGARAPDAGQHQHRLEPLRPVAVRGTCRGLGEAVARAGVGAEVHVGGVAREGGGVTNGAEDGARFSNYEADAERDAMADVHAWFNLLGAQDRGDVSSPDRVTGFGGAVYGGGYSCGSYVDVGSLSPPRSSIQSIRAVGRLSPRGGVGVGAGSAGAAATTHRAHGCSFSGRAVSPQIPSPLWM